MTTRHGLCTNFGLCSKADGREPIAAAQEFVCPECGKQLGTARQGSNSGRRTALMATGAAVLVAGGLYALVPAAPAPVAPDPTLQTDTSPNDVTPETPRRSRGQNQRSPSTRASNEATPRPGPRVPFDPSDETGALDETHRQVRVAGRPGRSTGTHAAPELPETTAVLPAVPIPATAAPVAVPTAASLPAAASAVPIAPPLNKTAITVELLKPVVATNRGDTPLEGRVAEGSFAGATVRGVMRGSDSNEGSAFVIEFDSIELAGVTRTISAEILDLETADGRPVGRKSLLGKREVIGSAIGAALGGITGRDLKTTLIGAGTGLGVSLVAGMLTSPSSDLKLEAGTRFVLKATDAPSRSNR